jgi:hypothetical protein
MAVSSPYAVFRAVDLGWPPRSAAPCSTDPQSPLPRAVVTGSSPLRLGAGPLTSRPWAPSPSRPAATPGNGGCPPSPRSSKSKSSTFRTSTPRTSTPRMSTPRTPTSRSLIPRESSPPPSSANAKTIIRRWTKTGDCALFQGELFPVEFPN